MSFRRISIIAIFLFSVSAVTVWGQNQASAPVSKVVIIDTSVFFNEKNGITRIIAAAKTLSNELSSKRDAVRALIARVETVSKEVETFRANAVKGIPIDEKTFQAKVDEVERLKREGKYEEEEFNALAQKRQNEIVGPVYSEVIKVLGEYVKTKDYGILFDASKDQNGMLIYASDKYDITKEFITFYNTRPVTAIGPVPR